MKDKQSRSDKVNNLKNYHTKQKSQIRDIFINHPNDNFTVDKLMILLTKNKTPVSKATLYRNLEFMIDNGEIMKYNIDKNCSCYQYKTCDNSNHIHFKCQNCGAILHIENPIVKQMDVKIEQEYGVVVDSTKINFIWHVCKVRGKRHCEKESFIDYNFYFASC